MAPQASQVSHVNYGSDDQVRRAFMPDLSLKLLAHDLNNVLQIIAMNLELLECSISDTTGARRYLSRAQKGVDLGHALAIRALQPPVANQSVRRSLSDQLSDLEDLIATAMGPDVALDIDIGAALAPVLVDVSELKNVVLNLVINARDAMDRRGSLAVSIRNCPHATHVILEIADSGPGIPPDVMGRIFDPLFSTKSDAHQRGFGLATVFAFAKDTGTTIDIDSRQDVGTRMVLRLPVRGLTIDAEPIG
jgi:signal transduction histidine kinase